MPHARTGKIARAPFAIRTRVNEMIRDGYSALTIISFLDEHEIRGINDDNISRWRSGGYQDWLATQDRAQGMRDRQEFAMEIVKAGEGSKLGEAALYLASDQLYQVLTDFDLDNLKELLKDAPENYAAIVNSLSKLSKGLLENQKYKDLVAEQKRKIESALETGKSKGGLTKEALAEIERAAAML